MSEARILTLDIETAPLKVYAWGLWDQNTGLNQIDTEWSILSVCAKWLGQKPMYLDVTPQTDLRDDRHLLRWLHSLLGEADIVVCQNGVSFDLKKINARLIAEGFKPYSPVRVIDTKLVAKKHFGFTSNKLEWMATAIAGTTKSKHKKFPGFELWDECLKGNPAAWAEMKKYNVRDVIATEKLYLKMRPWIEGHPNVNTYVDGEDCACPKCGSLKMQKRGVATTQVGRFTRYQCQSCGGWSRASRTELPKAKKRSLLTN